MADIDRDDVSGRLARDAELLWHPYSSMSNPGQVRLVEHADGAVLYFADGTTAIDAMASWWCMIHGYRNPVLDQALRSQINSMSHVMFGGLTHEPAITLAERLVAITPEPLQKVFLSDSGSVSVEVAIKLSLQYQLARGHKGRSRMMTIRGGYHGDTFAAMSVCDPVTGMHSMFTGALQHQVFAPRPPAGFDRAADDDQLQSWVAETAEIAERNADLVAGIIVEPVLQGAGGMYAYSPHCLMALREIADRHNFVLVFDEIATGFGRTGEMFASEHTGISADILCVGKALTGGYLSMAATLCTSEIAETVSSGPGGALMHGPTFMANPLACAVSIASIDLLLSQDWQGNIHRIERELIGALSAAEGMVGVKEVRVLGGVGVIQLESPAAAAAITEAALHRGVWLRPFLDLVYTMPPYISTDEQLATIGSAMSGAIEEVVA